MAFNWNDAPGTSPAVRRRSTVKKLLGSLLVGMLSIGVAWAGTGLVPVNDFKGSESSNSQDGNWLASESSSEGDSQAAAAAGASEPLQANQVYAGAAKVSINPNPDAYGGTWEKDRQHCETNAVPIAYRHPEETEPGMVTDFRVRWNENTNCIYTGGFDIGPANAATDYDREFGLWARATAISDGEDTVVLLILDGTYYFAKYGSMCNDDPAFKSAYDGDGPGANNYTQDCGFRDLQNSMAAKYGYTGANNRGEHGIEPASFFLASSHAHAAPDFIGAWGGVPRWYMQQTEDAIRSAVYAAIDSMKPAFVEGGEILYRDGNNNRRGHYWGAEEAGESWMRFVSETPSEPVCTTPAPTPKATATPTPTPSPSQPKKTPRPPKVTPSPTPTASSSPSPDPTPTPVCTTPPPQKNAIATVGTYAAHPTDHSNGRLYADLAAVFATRAEQRFGGVGLYFQTGFGDQSSAIDRRDLGKQLVDLIPAVGEGTQVTTGAPLDVRTTQRFFDHPVTNGALGPGGASGVFDRPMEPKPSAVSIGRESLTLDASRSPHKRCNSASPITVNSSVSIARVGPANGGLLITGGPGELFSNLTNTIKERSVAGTTLPLSLVNEGLGYIMQSFETDHVARQAVGFYNSELSEYEDAYSIDACFGDHVLEQTLAGMNSLGG
jgi:hypothetical protein